MKRLSVLPLLILMSAPVMAEPSKGSSLDGDVRTGGMGIGARPTAPVVKPGTDMTTAGSGTGEGKPGGKTKAIGSTDGKAPQPR